MRACLCVHMRSVLPGTRSPPPRWLVSTMAHPRSIFLQWVPDTRPCTRHPCTQQGMAGCVSDSNPSIIHELVIGSGVLSPTGCRSVVLSPCSFCLFSGVCGGNVGAAACGQGQHAATAPGSFGAYDSATWVASRSRCRKPRVHQCGGTVVSIAGSCGACGQRGRGAAPRRWTA